MKRISLSRRELLLISILAAAVLIYLYLNFMLFPSYERIGELRTELQQIKQIAVSRDDVLKKVSSLDSLLLDEQHQLDALERKIPYNVRLPELIVNIDDKIKELGMDVKSIAIGETDQANKDFGIVPINVDLEGKYDDIVEFIRYIEGNERKYLVESFVLSPLRRSKQMPFSISFKTFMLKESESPLKAEPSDYPFFRHDNGKSYPFLEQK